MPAAMARSRSHGAEQGRDRNHGAPSQRRLRVGEALRHALAEILARGELRDPILLDRSITVSEVRVSPDLRNATAFVLPLGGEGAADVVRALDRAGPYLSGQIGRLVRLKYTPRLSFRLDELFDNAGRIESLLRSPAVNRDLAEDRERDETDPDGDGESDMTGVPSRRHGPDADSGDQG